MKRWKQKKEKAQNYPGEAIADDAETKVRVLEQSWSLLRVNNEGFWEIKRGRGKKDGEKEMREFGAEVVGDCM